MRLFLHEVDADAELDQVREIPLADGITTIGREHGRRIPFPHVQTYRNSCVSGIHCYLKVENGTVTLFDGRPEFGDVQAKRSANGTWLRGAPVSDSGVQVFGEGDRVNIWPRSHGDGETGFSFWVGNDPFDTAQDPEATLAYGVNDSSALVAQLDQKVARLTDELRSDLNELRSEQNSRLDEYSKEDGERSEKTRQEIRECMAVIDRQIDFTMRLAEDNRELRLSQSKQKFALAGIGISGALAVVLIVAPPKGGYVDGINNVIDAALQLSQGIALASSAGFCIWGVATGRGTARGEDFKRLSDTLGNLRQSRNSMQRLDRSSPSDDVTAGMPAGRTPFANSKSIDTDTAIAGGPSYARRITPFPRKAQR